MSTQSDTKTEPDEKVTKWTKKFVDHVACFCRSTSIKGIPRVFNSEMIFIKLVWLVAVVCFLTLAVMQTHALYDLYAKHQILIVTKELPWFEIENTLDSPPAFTICDSHRPTNPQRETDQEFESIEAFSHRLSESISAIQNRTANEIRQHISRVFSTGYLETIGLHHLGDFSKNFSDFVIHCSFKVLPLSDSKNDFECADWIDVWLFSTPSYPTCFVVHLNPGAKYELLDQYGVYVVGFKLIVYTGVFNETFNSNWTDRNRIIDDNNGALLSLHNVESAAPIMNAKMLAPGFVHSMDVLSMIRERINTDKSPCLENQKYRFYDIYNGEYLPYNQDVCLAACVEDAILEECGCLNQDALFSSNQVSHDTHYCGRFDDDLSVTLDSLACAQRHNGMLGRECIFHCAVPCKEVIHDYRHSFTRWPSAAQKLHFYREFIRNRTFADQFSSYEYFEEIALNNTEQTMELLRQDRLIEENFMQIDIYDMQTTLLKLEDVPQMTLINFIGQLGGVLNLYAGITVVVLVELLEFFILLFKPCCLKVAAKCKQMKFKDNNKIMELRQAKTVPR